MNVEAYVRANEPQIDEPLMNLATRVKQILHLRSIHRQDGNRQPLGGTDIVRGLLETFINPYNTLSLASMYYRISFDLLPIESRSLAQVEYIE